MSGAARARVEGESRSIVARLSAMSERTRAMLEYHFEHDARQIFKVASSTDTPDVVIIDYDHPGTRAAVEAGRWREGPPLLALAHGSPELEAIVVVGKPFDRAELDAAAARLHDPAFPSGVAERARHAPESLGATPTSGPDAEREFPVLELPVLELVDAPRRPRGPDAASLADDGAEDARGRTRVEALCGVPRTLAELADPTDLAHRYDPDRHLVGHLSSALATLDAADSDVRGVALLLPDVELYVLPWLGRVCTSEPLTCTATVERTFRPLDAAEVELVIYRRATVDALVGRVKANASQSYPLAAFRWLAALFSARGRLPFGADVRRPIRLLRWPAFTRVERTPGCLDIAAEWTRTPHSVESMVEHLGCEPRFVTTLYAGAAATGLLKHVGR